ncbi:MAG: ABC-type transport auxiliary lipoprotein family protein [Burkholderiales bacterium]
MNRTLLPILVCAALAAGCAVGEHPPAARLYDFGISQAADPLPASVAIADVQAPDWLSRPDMLYRLAYRDPRSLEPYAMSRWAGTPASLLTQRLRKSFESVPLRRAQCVLQIQIEEFSQVFDAPDSSRAVLRAQATLLESTGIKRMETRSMRLEQRTPTADAAGGAAAFAVLADEVAGAMRAWVADRGYCQ